MVFFGEKNMMIDSEAINASSMFVHRMLQRDRQSNSPSTGTLLILIISVLFFCCAWAPRMYYRLSCFRRHQEARRMEARVLQMSLEATGEGADHQPCIPHGMSLDDRRDFVENVLVTKHVVLVDNKDGLMDPKMLKEMEQQKSDLIISQSHKAASSRSLGHPDADEELDDIDENIPSCAICLTAYCAGEEICWSHNHGCNHVFHKGCITEWLLRHDGCPCCRHNFLSIEDTDEENQMESELNVDGLEGLDSVGRAFDSSSESSDSSVSPDSSVLYVLLEENGEEEKSGENVPVFENQPPNAYLQSTERKCSDADTYSDLYRSSSLSSSEFEADIEIVDDTSESGSDINIFDCIDSSIESKV